MNQRRYKFAPLATRPNLNPKPFDPNAQTFVPDQSLDTSKVRELNIRKVQMLGCKIYDAGGNNTGINDSNDYVVKFDTVEFARGFIAPTGATFTTIKVPYDGVYLVVGRTEWAFSGTPTDCRLTLKVNGTAAEGESARTTSGIRNRRNLMTIAKYSAGDVVGLQVRHEDDAPANRDLNIGADACALTIIYQGAI